MSEVKVIQPCPALCNPMDCTVHEILQARILEWVAFSFSRASSQPRNRTQVSHIAGRFFTNWGTRRAQVQNPVLSFTIEWTGENYLHTAGLKKKILIVFLSKSCYESLNRTHSSTLAWKTPWTEERGRLQSMGSQRVGHDWATSLSLSPWVKCFAEFLALSNCSIYGITSR